MEPSHATRPSPAAEPSEVLRPSPASAGTAGAGRKRPRDRLRGDAAAAPRFLTLWHIRFPIGAIASILHRVSGVLLLVALPLLALALDRSLRGPDEYGRLVELLRSPAVALPMIAAAWALAHHVFAGIRHLLMDVGVGVRLAPARASATAAIAAGLVAAIVAALWWLA